MNLLFKKYILEISLSTVWKDFLSFAKNPRLDPLSETFWEQPQRVFPYLLAIDFLLMIPLMGIMSMTGIEDTDHELTQLLDNPLALFGMAVILAPILEELFFRFPIGRFWNIPTRFFGIPTRFFGGAVDEYPKVNWWSSNFKIIFWIFTIVFAAVHFSNFASTVSIYLAPILVLPQLVLGVMLGYIRVGWGTRYSMLFHGIHNAIPLSLMLLGGELS